MTKLGIAVCTALAFATGCKFSPEQRLLPEAPELEPSDAGRTVPRRGMMSSAVSSAGRRAEPMPSERAAIGQASSKPSAAGSGGKASAALDAGVNMPAAMDQAQPTQAPRAGSGGMQLAAGGQSGAAGARPDSTPQKPAGALDPTCDLSGIWATKQIAVGLALEAPQFMNTWGYYEIEQSGAEFVVKKHLDCGAEVLGSGTVTLTHATMEGNVQHNMQDGRKGRFELLDGKCVLTVAHYWSVRGAEEARYIPNPTRDSTMSMAELAKLKPLPTPRMPDGAFDLEGDGELGAAGQINGIVSGTRNSCQRDWDHWFTAPGYEITPSMDFTSDLKVRMEYEAEESVMAPTSGLLTTPTDPTDSWDHIMYFRFLGRSVEDARAQPIVHEDAVETCYAVQDAMPAEELQR